MSSYRKYFTYFILNALLISLALIKTHNLIDDSGFYVGIAEVLQKVHFIKDFPWLTGTYLGSNFPGLHFLYPYLLIPFVAAFGPIAGAAISSSFFLSGLLTTIYYILSHTKVKSAAFWPYALLILSPDFIFRATLTRPLVLSSILLLWFSWFLQQKKFFQAGAIGFLTVWCYNGYLILLVPLIIYWLISFKEYKSGFLYPLIGITLGLVINPYFPNNILFLKNLLHPATVGNFYLQISEWQRYPLADLIKYQAFFLVLLFSSIGLAKNRKKNLFLLLSIALFVLTLKYRRFVDYLIPVGIVFAASTIDDYLPKLPALRRYYNIKVLYSAGFIALAVLCWLTFNNLKVAYHYIYQVFPVTTYRSSIEAIGLASKPGEIIFNPRWEQFPELFVWNQKNYYVAGLDSSAMYQAGPEKFWLWQHIANNERTTCPTPICGPGSADLVNVIRDDFSAKFIFVDKKTNPYLADLLLKEGSRILYEDDGTAAFDLR